MKRFKGFAVVLLGMLFLFNAQSQLNGQEGTITILSTGGEKITILHSNFFGSDKDSSHKMDDAFTFSEFVMQTRASEDRTLTLFPGSSMFSKSRMPMEEDVLQAMSDSGYDASGLGSGEFAQGEAALAEAIAEGARFPYLASNLVLDDGNPLQPLYQPFEMTSIDALRQGELGGKIFEGLLVDYDELSVCLFGLLDSALASTESLSDSIQISDPTEAALRMVETCEANDVDLIIALIHMTSDVRLDAQIKGEVEGIDVFVVGGTNEVFNPQKNPAAHLVQTSKGLSLSVQSTDRPYHLGRLDLTVSNRRIFEFSFNNLDIGPASGSPFGFPMIAIMAGIGALLVGLLVFMRGR